MKKINYQLPSTDFVSLKVFDILGKEILTLVNEKQNAGSHSVNFDGRNLPSGVYFYKIVAEGNGQSANGRFLATRKMMLLK